MTVANIGTGEPILAPGTQFVARTDGAFTWDDRNTCANEAFPNYPREWAGVTGEIAGTPIEVWCVSSQAIQARVSVFAGSRMFRLRAFLNGDYRLVLKTPTGKFEAWVRLVAAAPGILEQGVPHNAPNAPYGMGGIWFHAPGPSAMGFLVPPAIPVLANGGTHVQVWCTGVMGAAIVTQREVIVGGRVLPAYLRPTGFAGIDALLFEIPGDMAGMGEVELRLKVHWGWGYGLSPAAKLILQ